MAIGAAIPVLALIGWQERDPLTAAADDVISRLSTDEGPTPMLGSPLSGVGAGTKVVRLRPRPELDVPVTRVTRWSLSDPRFGRVSVYVPIGQTPREALTIAIAERGYQVVR